MAGKSMAIRDFLDLVEAAYLSGMDGDCGQARRVWSLLQVHFGNPQIHWEVWPQRKTGRIEVGLHFEAEREKSYEWAARLGEFAGIAFAELGPQAELEEWTPSWTRVHETLEFQTLSEGLAEVASARLVAYVRTLRPLLEAADIPFTTPPPITRRKAPARQFHRRRRARRQAAG
jgi:hypothetical protein